VDVDGAVLGELLLGMDEGGQAPGPIPAGMCATPLSDA
jgi:hypothetical protein